MICCCKGRNESKPKTVAEMVEQNPDRVIDKTKDSKKLPTGGLAAAVAAAKEVEDNVQIPESMKVINTPGVKRI